MRLTKKNSTLILECRRDEAEIPRQAGFVFYTIVKDMWATKSPVVAARLYEYAEGEAKEFLKPYAEALDRNLKHSRATTSDFSPPVPEGKELYPFQKAGVEEIERRMR